MGVVYTDLAYLDTFAATCGTCHGRRFTDQVLKYTVDGRSIGDILEATVGDARGFFAGHRRIAPILRALVDVGLDYLRLGQPLTSLSGGECQRIKLAAQLHRPGAVYILDEPTAGLHPSDVDRLLDVLDRLVDEHHATVLVIEHNLDVIGHADHVIDLGPDGGTAGGELLFSGTPAALLDATGSHTGTHLRRAVREPAAAR
jgi:excinuclease UvrABC ATPase subunit